MAINGLRQMVQWFHQFGILASFFDDVAGDIEWGGDDYDVTSLFDVSDLAEGLLCLWIRHGGHGGKHDITPIG